MRPVLLKLLRPTLLIFVKYQCPASTEKKKDLFPSLSDPIYKLKKIGENGDRHKQLEKTNINLVKDFLWFYNKDTNNLREV